MRGTPAEYSAGLKLAIERGWLWLHESGTYVKFTDSARPYLPEQRGWPPICLAYCYRPFDPDDVPDLKEEEEEGLEPNGTHSKPDERLGEKIGGEDA